MSTIKEMNELTVKMLKPLSVVETYIEQYSIPEVKNSYGEIINTTATRIIFPKDRVASIIWDENIEKFSILALDYESYAQTLFNEIKSDLNIDDTCCVICENENEIIEALELIRTAVKLSSLSVGDMFNAYSSGAQEWQTFMIADNSETNRDLAIINLSVGTFWSIDDKYNEENFKWVLPYKNPFIDED